jgi:phenylpropionate dioxygenase-like ring-hydroxylating dioxygenase large terminal subunit
LAVRGRDGVARVFLNACRHRGAQVACGSGKGAAFACPYHGWTYALDGALAAVPHEAGFPGLDRAVHGLVPVRTEERAGLVWVTLDADSDVPSEAEALEGVIGPDLRLISTSEQVVAANWKIFAEGFMEGYHILPTHRTTFYPAQFDNLNVVQAFGRSSRVTFPYRNIEKLRGNVQPGLNARGVLSHVYCLFPSVILATFPKRLVMVTLDPIDVATTASTTYVLAAPGVVEDDAEGLAQATDFVNRGAAEDRAMVESIQAGMATGANDAFTFGRFEAAIVHFHQTLRGMLPA